MVWDANGGGGGGRQVTFDVSTENDTAGQSQNNGGGGGTITITLPVNQLPETVTDTADSAEEFVQSHETLGEWVGGKFTYSSESLGALITSESIDYTISLIYYTWEFIHRSFTITIRSFIPTNYIALIIEFIISILNP